MSLCLSSAALPAADFAYLEPLAEEELRELRGGFQISGLDMSFGATLQTLVDNVRMDTVFVINGAGTEIVSQTITQHGAIDGQVVSQVGQGSGKAIMELTPSGINLTGMKDFPGLVVNDAKGFTSVFHSATRDAILGSVVSNASQREIQQRLDIGVQVNNLPALQAAQQRHAITESLAR
ncbi:hypothetical protein HOP62_14410 [Halomonas sp. MCCC 1A17488]|uniref:hypothetical protein n=1 Tax=unclassified Halomonas TaxID=2609666 RepID=UPI0018D2238E|nr:MULTISPECIES: hypothetical protein [unclassified Halomonas]MCE8017269.1 hypothetical protein [Halomonas sp. MCCC 1A17488]MCG3240602.1 hypothetical protein [Halomonas sp. MCCC 1A17488]QPP49547.1 hypothetical protein I4484_20730 [Halomonas sp. SS10-MC5]